MIDPDKTLKVQVAIPGMEILGIKIPEVSELIAPIVPHSWVEQRANALAGAQSVFDRIASLGFLAHFGTWLSRDRANVQAACAIGRLKLPLATIALWAAGIHALSPDEEGMDVIEREFSAAIQLVSDEITEMLPSLIGDEAFIPTARAVCHRREDVQGVGIVLALAGRGEVTQGLKRLDLLTSPMAAEMAKIPSIYADDPLLTTLALANPEVWWSFSSLRKSR